MRAGSEGMERCATVREAEGEEQGATRATPAWRGRAAATGVRTRASVQGLVLP
jgi:hypothetical protein